jgi:hypothetical protein
MVGYDLLTVRLLGVSPRSCSLGLSERDMQNQCPSYPRRTLGINILWRTLQECWMISEATSSYTFAVFYDLI